MRILFIILSFSFYKANVAQDVSYAREVVQTLCSPDMEGRGYVNEGNVKAAKYIAEEFNKIGIQPIAKGYFQKFCVFINTFPAEMMVTINSKLLTPGKDYIVKPHSGSGDGTFEVIHYNQEVLGNKNKSNDFQMEEFRNKAVVLDFKDVSNEDDYNLMFFRSMNNTLRTNAIVEITDEKLKWGIEMHNADIPFITVKREALPKDIKTITFNIKNKFLDSDTSQNVIGIIKGKTKPHQYIIISAHYDHLGKMGAKTYFPGANDNASGVAMMLNLAKYFVKNPPDYSIVFVAFGAEEIGLWGSQFFTENPLIPLNQIRFVINMDIVGTGDEGITVVNAPDHIDEFNSLVDINHEKKYLQKIEPRENANNSDHYMFTQKNVPAFFIYTLGGINAYHHIDDKPETLPFTKFENLFQLITDFVKKL